MSVAFILAFSCVATTCEAPVGLKISGGLATNVEFALSDLGKGRDTVTLTEVVVVHQWEEEVWRLRGKSEVHSFAYGEAPKGLSVVAGPAALVPGNAYSIVVTGESGWGRRAVGECGFWIDDLGAVRPEPGC